MPGRGAVLEEAGANLTVVMIFFLPLHTTYLQTAGLELEKWKKELEELEKSTPLLSS